MSNSNSNSFSMSPNLNMSTDDIIDYDHLFDFDQDHMTKPTEQASSQDQGQDQGQDQDQYQDPGQDQTDDDQSDDDQIKTESDAKEYLTSLLRDIKDKFGVRKTKKILNAAAKLAGLQNDAQENIHQLQPIDIKLYKERISKFNDVTNDFTMDVNLQYRNIDELVDNCCLVHARILQFKHTKWATEVAEFAGFLQMHRLFTLGSNSSNPRLFDSKMKAYLEKEGSQYSKYKAKCRRVAQIADILNPQTAILLAYNINIATLENANKQARLECNHS